MDCPGHHDTPVGSIVHSECPRQCLEDGYPPLPGDPEWPDEETTTEPPDEPTPKPPDEVGSDNPE
jgi:hypothetical protein